MKHLRIFFSALALCFLFASCSESAESAGDKDNTPADSVSDREVVEVKATDARDYPVNNLPDNYFFKQPERIAVKNLLAEKENLNISPNKMPEGVEQIISRESIVLFSLGIMNELPDEVEFAQTSQTVMKADNGWNAFQVTYTTRPSNAKMLIYGAYKDAETVFWTSEYDKENVAVELKYVSGDDNEVVLQGTRVEGKAVDGELFQATIGKDAVELKLK